MNLLVNHKNDEECLCKYLYDFSLEKSQKFTSQHLLSNKICMKSIKKESFIFLQMKIQLCRPLYRVLPCVLLHFSVVNVCSGSCSYLQKCTMIFKAKNEPDQDEMYINAQKAFSIVNFLLEIIDLKLFPFLSCLPRMEIHTKVTHKLIFFFF